MPEHKVLLISHGYEAIYERGFCNGVIQAGQTFTLVSSDRSDTAGLDPRIVCCNLRGSQEESRPRWLKGLNLLTYHCRLMFKVVRERPVVHLFGLLHPAWLCGVLEGLLFRVFARRYIVTAHDLLPHDRHTRWARWLFGLSYRLAHRVVVHTPRMAADLVRIHRVDARRIVVMEHGLEPLATLSPTVPDRPVAPGAPLRVLFFGKVMRYKGVDLLLQALADFPLPFSLVVAGGCWEPALVAELRAAMAAHPQAGSISWGGQYVPEPEIPVLFQQADLVVLPYRHIDQSGILFQALRYGVPVVASRVGSFEHYVSSEVGETFDKDDAAGLRQALLRLAARRGELTHAQLRAVARRYEWPITAAALLPVYRLQDGLPP